MRRRKSEEKAIGDLKRQWQRNTIRSQQKVGVSPLQASGAVALAFYRGMAVERENIIKSLKRKYPEAANYLMGAYN